MRVRLLLLCILVPLAAAWAHSAPQAEVRAGFHTSSLLLEEVRGFHLNVTIFSGGSRVVSGEFNVSYPPECVSLSEVRGGGGWVLFSKGGRYVFYVDPTLRKAPNVTVVAMLLFTPKEGCAGRTFNITLASFKAADANGRDLSVELNPAAASVTLAAGGAGGGAGAEASVLSRRRGESLLGWVVLAAIAVVASVTVAALYLRARALPGYYLLDQHGRLLFTGRGRDYTYGREDFVGRVPPHLLQYITRKSKGGQFRIFAYGGTYYIEDRYSTNPTLVDGVSIRGKGPVPLRDGSVITLPGGFQLIFRRTGRR